VAWLLNIFENIPVTYSDPRSIPCYRLNPSYDSTTAFVGNVHLLNLNVPIFDEGRHTHTIHAISQKYLIEVYAYRDPNTLY
jgi:hypothetical protein